MPVLELSHLTFAFRHQPILDAAEMVIDQPGVYGLVAPNGSGKTTLLDLIAHLRVPAAGTIRLFDQPNTPKQVFETVAYLQDNSVLYPYLTGQAHLDFIAATHHVTAERMAATVAQMQAGDFLRRRVRAYSLGMKQRLLMVMALATDAPLLVLDEPLNGLDPTSLHLVRDAVLAQAAAGKTVLISSHNLDELMRVTDQVWFLQGRQLHAERLGSATAAAARYAELFEAAR